MAQVVFGSSTYELPVLANGEFAKLQDRVRERQAEVADGVRERKALFGLIPRAPQPLPPGERYRSLRLLVDDYRLIIRTLEANRTAYAAFFTKVSQGVRAAIERKSDEVAEMETERRDLLDQAERDGDELLRAQVADLEARLLASVRLMAQAALLVLKKVDLCSEALRTLAEDEAAQARVLEDLLARLDAHRRALELQQRIEGLERDVAQMANVAIGFESRMRESLGPLQTLIESVSAVDSRLHRAVLEIESLTRALVAEQASSVIRGLSATDDKLIDFLVASNLRRERLDVALRDCTRVDGLSAALEEEEVGDDDPPSVLDALENLAAVIAWAAPAPKAKGSARSNARRRAELKPVEDRPGAGEVSPGWYGEPMPAGVRRGAVECTYQLESSRGVDPIELLFVPPAEVARQPPFDPVTGMRGGPLIEVAPDPDDAGGYYIAAYPVRAADVEAFCRATRRKPPGPPPEGSSPDAPAVEISWEMASAFCRFVHGRLPRVAEHRAAVERLKDALATPAGLVEWTADVAPKAGKPKGARIDPTPEARMVQFLKGGSAAKAARPVFRRLVAGDKVVTRPSRRYADVGFRVVVDLDD